ncbi:synaptotagmin-4 [Corythoichthys intestinalis]|uniref:synaptotagmin-4 n=1 Tax=Corythoichthys intestinalis TaxID=161448 RepID=UPI0025A62E8F|nr:synaptotagmin-4 [Corythoichthys intestinalis]XP_061810675.1 synaptotagmin-4-like [Nerophis lumbriciformis]
MAPMTLEDGAQPMVVPAGVAMVSIFGLVFTVSAFAWICCQRKNTKGQKTPPYKFVHMLKGVDIYPESLGGKKKFASPAGAAMKEASKIDVNGNCHTAAVPTGSPRSSPGDSRSTLHLDLEQRDLNGNFPTKLFPQHKVRSSPDLELPSPQAGFTQPAVIDAPSPSSAISSQAPTPAVDDRDGRLGTLHFALEYQPEKKAFIVHIKEAHGLSPTDEQSMTSDPYIKLTLLPEKKHRVKTRVLRKTLDPTFDETFSFYGIPLARVSELALQFMVLSFDRFSRDEIIGETLVPLSGIDLSEGRVLMSREIIKKNVKKSSGRGELLLSLCYQSTTNTLTVVVLKARHLPKNDNHRPTDPYVKVNLYHGKKRVCKKKTHVKKCAPNPVFNELFTFDLPSDEGLRDTGVELLLMDSDAGDARSPKPVLGRLLLGTTAAGTAGEHWREICEHPRRQIAKWHAMSED